MGKKHFTLYSGAAAFLSALIAFAPPVGSQAASKTAAQNNIFANDTIAFEESDTKRQLKADAKAYPSYFDLRDVNGKSYVTPVRLQNPFGTCWGFSTIATVESAILADEELGKDVTSDTLDLSEHHLAWFANHHIEKDIYTDDPAHDQTGEGTYANSTTEKNAGMDLGGHARYGTSMFASGMGPASEAMVPYKGEQGEIVRRKVATEYGADNKPTKYEYKDVWYSNDDDWSVSEDYRYASEYRLRESYMLPSPAGEDDNGNYVYSPEGCAAIKDQIINHHRSVSIFYHAEAFLPGQNTSEAECMSDKWAHYTSDEHAGDNHLVSIVGYDDNYPKENFLEGNQPPADGAFLVKNSWGSEMNDFPNNGYRHWGLLDGQDGVPYDANAKANSSSRSTGYFWLSYYDKSITSVETFDFDKKDNGTYVGQWDNMGCARLDKIDKTGVKMANVFKAQATSNLYAVSCITQTPGTEVYYQVYLLPGDYKTPQDGEMIASGTRTFQYGGYHRIDLGSQSAVLAKGQDYAVVISQKAPESGAHIIRPTGFAKGGMTSLMTGSYQIAVVNPYESFLYSNGSWGDLSVDKVKNSLIGEGEKGDIVIDNFPVKSYLDPIWMDNGSLSPGYLVISHGGADANNTCELDPDGKTSLGAYIRGEKAGHPPTDIDVKWRSTNESVFTISLKENSDIEIRAIGSGTAFLIADAGKYGRRLVRVNVKEPILQITDLFLQNNKAIYTGKAITPDFMVGSNLDEDVKEGIHYKVKFTNNVKCGTAKLIVSGLGKYKNTLTKSFTIIPAKAAIKSLKASKKTIKVTVKDQKKSGITGYQISYCEKGSKKWTTKTLKASSTVCSLSGLKQNKAYQIRVRGYVKISKTNHYGAWSAVSVKKTSK